MGLIDIAITALRELGRNRLRSFLTTLGIIIGVFSVIAIVSVGQGAEHMVTQTLRSFGANMVWVIPGGKIVLGSHQAPANMNTLTPDDARAIAQECPSATAVAPMAFYAGTVVLANQNWTTRVQGTTEAFPQMRDWPIERGSFFTAADVMRAGKVCVLGKTVATKLLGDVDPVGKLVRIKNMPFRVLGCLAPKGQTGWGQDQDDVVMAPFSTVMKKLTGTIWIQGIQVMTQGTDSVAAVQDEITQLLDRRHRIQPGAEPDFGMISPRDILAMVERIYGTLVTFLATVAAITLFVGGVGVMNIMLVSVTERTREIGIRVAVGARGRDILVQFLLEAILLSVVGGVLGVVCGVAMAELIAIVLKWPIFIDPATTAVAFSFSALVGVTFGLFPAWRASQLDPINALREE